MKKHMLPLLLILVFTAEFVSLLVFASEASGNPQDTVAVNEALQSVQEHWDTLDRHKNHTSLDYVVLDKHGAVLFRTRDGLSESLNMAIRCRDTILTIESGGAVVGSLIIHNDSAQSFQKQKQKVVIAFAFGLFVQGCASIGYLLYINRTITRPFRRLEGFASRVAEGNLDIPLEMDRQNLFGAFTESFDLMRAELKKARKAEAQANASKKELVAKLSHDIRTPVASIKAASEAGAAFASDEKTRETYTQIIRKADQINVLITDLFTAALEELGELAVSPTDIESPVLAALLKNSDYLHRAAIPGIPECMIYADKLRLQQVFDNLFSNSYKYADTEIEITVYKDGRFLAVSMEDCGGGVPEEELPLLKEKFKRGSNTAHIEGAGLGLFVCNYFMKEMHGGLTVENGRKGLKVTVRISQSGQI